MAVLDHAPEGWKVVGGCTNAPAGYRFISNNKSRFGGEYQHALVKEEMTMKNDLTIFRYSTMLTLTRNGISTIAELEAMTNEDIGRLRGLGKRGYDEILAVLGRQDPARQESH